jgi:hypothetical protein
MISAIIMPEFGLKLRTLQTIAPSGDFGLTSCRRVSRIRVAITSKPSTAFVSHNIPRTIFIRIA